MTKSKEEERCFSCKRHSYQQDILQHESNNTVMTLITQSASHVAPEFISIDPDLTTAPNGLYLSREEALILYPELTRRERRVQRRQTRMEDVFAENARLEEERVARTSTDMRESFALTDDITKAEEPKFEVWNLYGKLNVEDKPYVPSAPSSSSDQKNVACTICQLNQAIVVFSCGHMITCKSCIETTRRMISTCSYCREKIVGAIIPW